MEPSPAESVNDRSPVAVDNDKKKLSESTLNKTSIIIASRDLSDSQLLSAQSDGDGDDRDNESVGAYSHSSEGGFEQGQSQGSYSTRSTAAASQFYSNKTPESTSAPQSAKVLYDDTTYEQATKWAYKVDYETDKVLAEIRDMKKSGESKQRRRRTDPQPKKTQFPPLKHKKVQQTNYDSSTDSEESKTDHPLVKLDEQKTATSLFPDTEEVKVPEVRSER
jgi:hypothetical protein